MTLAAVAHDAQAKDVQAQGTQDKFVQAQGTQDEFVQVPGIHRLQIDGLQITALFDGVVYLPVSQLHAIDSSRAQAWLGASHVPQTNEGVQTAVNAYAIRTRDGLVLVDAGTADCFGPGLGQIPDNMNAAGLKADEVRHVLLTHAHPDHLCGVLSRDGKMLFPNATVWLSAADAAFWLDPDSAQNAPKAMKPVFDMARRAVAPYQEAGRLKAFGPDDPLPAGVRALDTQGHTPGHVSWLIEGDSGKPALVVWGDVLHYHAVQFRRPDASFEFDSDRTKAVASRKRMLARAAKEDWWVAGAHLPFPGIGHVRREGDGYRWIATEFGPVTR